jgi:hypothetical protein
VSSIHAHFPIEALEKKERSMQFPAICNHEHRESAICTEKGGKYEIKGMDKSARSLYIAAFKKDTMKFPPNSIVYFAVRKSAS